MTVLAVPPFEEEPWPTLGPQVWQWMLASLIYGPGDLRGTSLSDVQPDSEFQGLLYRMYEVYPKGHPQEGRRRFKRVCLSLRKGTAKTEKAAWIAAAELHPESPVRCDGWRKTKAGWEPVGAPVTDPYIPMVAYTEEQSEDLAYGALHTIVSEGPLADDFDIGLERIMRLNGDGKAVALASAPDARDGARTTFQHFDETHRFTLPRLKEAHRTMMANLPKRKIADAWSLETTTAPSPGEGSIAEGTMDYAKLVQVGAIEDSRLFFFHRQASDDHDLSTDEGVKAAVVEASGPAAAWSDIESIVEQWRDPTVDRTYLQRVWLNRVVQQSDRAFDMEAWKSSTVTGHEVERRAQVAIGFDGSRYDDSTAIVVTEVKTGFQWCQIWYPDRDSEVDTEAVNVYLDDIFRNYRVWRMLCDPFKWETNVAEWAGRYGDEKVLKFETNRRRPMAQAVRAYANSIILGEVLHGEDPQFALQLGNAVRRDINEVDDDGERMWLIEKDRKDSPMKMDAAMAGCLSWLARMQAMGKGIGVRRSKYEDKELVML